jgi:NTP pyrophosphatase (non-canonical NTP hydrolase)
MTLTEYVEKALRTAGKVRGDKTYSMGGVGGEAGEYVDVVKKYVYHAKDYEESRAAACKELGDLMWGIAQAADAWNLTLEEVCKANIAKLLARYPNGYSHAASAARADMGCVNKSGIDGCDPVTPCRIHGCSLEACDCPDPK